MRDRGVKRNDFPCRLNHNVPNEGTKKGPRERPNPIKAQGPRRAQGSGPTRVQGKGPTIALEKVPTKAHGNGPARVHRTQRIAARATRAQGGSMGKGQYSKRAET